MSRQGYLLVCAALISSCSSWERLKQIGKPPQFSPIEVIAPSPNDDIYSAEKRFQRISRTNSLWQPGATTFFRDSRAWKVGDILRVTVQIQDSARLDNSTIQQRRGRDKLGINNLWGKEKDVAQCFSPQGQSNSLISFNRDRNQNGIGNISRRENIKTEIAATVQQVLPNGNLLIKAKQEIRVNAEMREIAVLGIIRPQDISSDNSINSKQIADAKISYGGQGVISEVQLPSYGSQIFDIISPF